MKKLIVKLILATLLPAQMVLAQNISKGFLKNNDVFGTRVFIENKGQFNHESENYGKILYALENGLERIYFTESGLVHKLVKYEPFTEEEREAIEKGKHFNGQKSEKAIVKMLWLNANKNIRVEAFEKQSYYFTYGLKEFNSHGYKKLIYHNVYHNIDFEYTFPADEKEGIKYNVILHPGANISDIQMLYTGDVEKIKFKNEGDVVIKTHVENITEHAPLTYYKSGGVVKSEFTLKNNVIGFIMPQGYDASRELVIDPWVTTIISLPSNNYGYDVDYDFNANTYVYGGYNPFKVALYNSLGVLQWVFAGAVPTATPAWSSAPITGQASNFGVNRFSGKTYIGQGYVGSGNRVIRLDATGNYDNFINAANNQFQEVWDMGFHCTSNEVFVLGGGTSSNISAVTINPTTAAISLSTFQPTLTSIAQDIVNNAIDDQGNIFVNYAGLSVNDRICRVNATFNGNLWAVQSGFTVFTEQGNKSQYLGAGALSSNGFNCLAVNANYLFYYDGLNVAAYNKTTGAITASTTVPLTLKRQGGIAVDDCNNLYLGGNGSILSYNFNGTSFSTLTSIPLALTSLTNQYVYDIKMDKQSKVLYVCGSGFVANYQASNSLSCPTATSACFNSQPTAQGICSGSSVTVTVGNPSGLGNPSYSIQPGGLSNTSGTFALTPTATIVYTTYVTGTNAGNIVVTQTSVANVTVFPVPVVAPTTTQTSCTSTVNGFNLNLTFSPPSATVAPYSILWSPVPNGINSATQTSAGSGIAAGLYNATITSANGCKTTASINIDPIPDPANFIITPFAPYVIDCYNPSLNISFNPPTLNYTVNNGLQAAQFGNTAVFTSTNAGGTQVVTAVHPVSGCTSTQTFVIGQNVSFPTSVLSPTFQNINCTLTTVQIVTATATPSVNIQHLWLAPQGGSLSTTAVTSSFNPLSPGTYTHMVINTANGCAVTKTFTVASSSGFPVFNIVSPQNFTLGCNAKATATINLINGNTSPVPGGPISYALVSPTAMVTTFTSATVFSVNIPGTYTAIVKDNTNQCETKVQFSVILNNLGPKLDTLLVPRTILNCDSPSVVFRAISSTPNTEYNWSLPGAGGNLPSPTITAVTNSASPTSSVAGNYTLTLTDMNSTCVTTTVVLVNQNLYPPNPVIALSPTAITCVTHSVNLTNQSSTGIPAGSVFLRNNPVVAYLWQGPSPMTPLQVSSTYVGLVPGVYTMTAKDRNNGCMATRTINVGDYRDYPVLNRNGAPSYTLDCGMSNRTITPEFDPSPDFVYTWIPENLTATGTKTNAVLVVQEAGAYYVNVKNKNNGCENSAVVNVVNGTLTAGFVPDYEFGYSPLTVTFSNTSTSSLGNTGITTVWNYGNGSSFIDKKTSNPFTTYNQPGTYTVTAYVIKGNCSDTAVRIIKVDIPSLLEIPNIFTPNNDGVNDVYFLRATNMLLIEMSIYDRWGHKVFNTSSDKGNIAWDGKNPFGKEVAQGVYFYNLKASGKDGTVFEKKGNITLIR